MKLTRSQLIVLIVLGVLAVGVFGCLVSIFVRNSQQITGVLVPTPTPPPSATPTEVPPPSPTPVPPSTPTPTPVAPQTRYDLQVMGDPQNPTLRLQRGYAYIALGAYTYALEDFDAAIGLHAGLAEAYLGRGEVRYHVREWSAAAEDFERAQALNPDLAGAHAWRGYLFSEWREYGLALEPLRQAVLLDEADPWKHLLLADALLHGGSPVEASIEYTAVLTINVRSIEAYVGRAMALAEQGDFDGAQADLNSALEIAPYDPLALNGQAWFYAWYRHDHLAEAEQLAQRAVAGARGDLERARYLHTLGWVYYQQGRYDEAAATLEQAAGLATVEGEVPYREILEHLEEVWAAQ